MFRINWPMTQSIEFITYNSIHDWTHLPNNFKFIHPLFNGVVPDKGMNHIKDWTIAMTIKKMIIRKKYSSFLLEGLYFFPLVLQFQQTWINLLQTSLKYLISSKNARAILDNQKQTQLHPLLWQYLLL